jgi:hypothetical protein
MDRTNARWTVPAGTVVVGADGAKVGKVVAARPTYLVVKKGVVFPAAYYIPASALADYDGERLCLRVTKGEALAGHFGDTGDDLSLGSATAAAAGLTASVRSRRATRRLEGAA